ncbi:MAG: DUF4197 domain-containing protein [Bacteroidales bacterium]|nr:DUF4197 domain-containing protein [Bacteroidales bacterium]MBN2812973.1 DUF4197 domain-containing protein [Bacteroidales bacterium]
MKKTRIHLLSAIVALLLLYSCTQFMQDLSNTVATSPAGLTENEAAAGIKEALIKGITEGVNIVSVVDGYFKNAEIKIPFPPEAANIESKLRAVGLGNQVDNAILSINRAAEDAAKEAKPIFVAAIKGLTISDAIGIVKGQENAATLYLQRTTTPELKARFEPVISNSLNKVNATKYWSDLINAYNKIPFVEKMNPNLAGYVTDEAIEGLFVMIAKEELKIRKDPVARTTELLKKVFSNQ